MDASFVQARFFHVAAVPLRLVLNSRRSQAGGESVPPAGASYVSTRLRQAGR